MSFPARDVSPVYCTGQTAIGIDTDCYARYMYWTDVTGKSIQRAKLDGTDSETILSGRLS